MARYVTLVAGLLVCGAVATWLRYGRVEPDRPPSFEQIPAALGDWSGAEHRFADYAYDVLGADTTTLRRYVNGSGDEIWLFIGYFASQKYGGQVHSPRHCLPGGGWSIARHERATFPGAADVPPVEVNELTITKPGDQDYMWYWFETRGGSVVGEYALKLDLVLNSLRLMPTDAAFIRITVEPADGRVETAAALAREFAASLRPRLVHALPFGSRVS